VPHSEDKEHHTTTKSRDILGYEPDEHRKDQGHGAGGPAQGKEDSQSKGPYEGRILEEPYGEVDQPLHDALLYRCGLAGKSISAAPA